MLTRLAGDIFNNVLPVDWLEQLRTLPPQRRLVHHEPETARYRRARRYLDHVVRKSSCLGQRPAAEGPEHAVEVALWCRSPVGRGCGFYSGIRVYVIESAVALAVLFCFYDGLDASPCIKSAEGAESYARTHGYEVPDGA